LDSDNPQRARQAPGGHETAPPKNLPKLAIAALVMFIVAIGIVWVASDILQRPGQDPGAQEARKAPAD
jgi:hypothetical protein